MAVRAYRLDEVKAYAEHVISPGGGRLQGICLAALVVGDK
jgi:hypothetical protein